MAFTQTNQPIQNKYDVASHDVLSQIDFRIPASDADDLPNQKASVIKKFARRFHLTSRRRWVLLAGLVLLGACVLLGSIATLGSQQAQVTPLSPTAEKYWRTVDIVQIQKDFKGWSREDLARVFVTVREQAASLETRKHIDSLGQLLRLPGFEATSSSSLLGALVGQPIFVMGIFLSIGIWGAAVVISIAPYVRRTPAPALNTTLLVPAEQPADATLEELLPDVTLEAATPDATEKKEEEKKSDQPQSSEQSEEASAGLGDLASLFEEEDTSISALEQFCKNLADVVIDDLSTKAKGVAHDLRNFVSQPAPRHNKG